MKRLPAVVLVLTLLAGLLAVAAQQARKPPRVGVLFSQSLTRAGSLVEAFRGGLRGLGWLEGQNILIEWRSAEGKVDRLPGLVAELARLEVDVLVTAAAPASLAAKQATTTIPIVSVQTADPVALGLVRSLARPGGNVTGLSGLTLEYTGKELELLREVVPRVSRVAVLGDPVNPSYAVYWRELDAAARKLGITLQAADARTPEELETAFSAIAKRAPDALFLMQQPFTYTHRVRIVEFATKSRLPTVCGFREYVEAGGLLSYGASMPDVFRRAAHYVDKILKGTKPGDIPVEQPSRFELVVNLKAAKALGLTIPQSLLQRADEVIQ